MTDYTYDYWAAQYPEAARALEMVIAPACVVGEGSAGKSEAWAQQQTRLDIARAGAFSWRNNVGATPAKCPDCGTPQQPVRYGLANDSSRLNKQIKSSDLILAIPRTITPDMVGTTLAQFGSVEMKAPGWTYTGKGREAGQAAWLALINKIGGFGCFTTGGLSLEN